MIDGFFGTKANLIIDITLLTLIILPFLMASAIYIAKRGNYDLHKRIQIIAFSFFIALIIILIFELQLTQLKDLIQKNSYKDSLQYAIIFPLYMLSLLHQILLWLWLIIKSYKRYPIHFRFNHKKWGKRLFLNTLLTSILGFLLYWMIFVS